MCNSHVSVSDHASVLDWAAVVCGCFNTILQQACDWGQHETWLLTSNLRGGRRSGKLQGVGGAGGLWRSEDTSTQNRTNRNHEDQKREKKHKRLKTEKTCSRDMEDTP